MPRHNGKNMLPIRSDYEADREIRRRSARGTLGVKRPVSLDSASEIRTALEYLPEMMACEPVFEDSIPKLRLHTEETDAVFYPVDVRKFFSLTLVQKNKVSRQLSNGFKGGYELHKAIPNIEHQTARSADMQLDVTIDRVSWRGVGERTLAIIFEEEELIKEEHRRTMGALGQLGLKGLDPEKGFVQHIGLGEARANFAFDEKRKIAETLECYLPDTITLEPLTIDADYQYANQRAMSSHEDLAV